MKEIIATQYKDIKARYDTDRNEMTYINENNTSITIKAWDYDTSAISYLYPKILDVLSLKEEFEKLKEVSNIPQIVSICKEEIRIKCLDIEFIYYNY